MSSDEARFRDGESLNQIDGVGSWAGFGVDGTYDPVGFGDRDIDDDEWCPDCQGDGFEDFGGSCMTCGGTGRLPAS